MIEDKGEQRTQGLVVTKLCTKAGCQMCWVIPLPLLRLKLIDKVIMLLRGSLIIGFSMYLALKKRSRT